MHILCLPSCGIGGEVVRQALASGSADGTIRLWRAADGRLLHTLQGHTDEVCCIAMCPDGPMLASASDDQIVRLWRFDPAP